MNKKTNFLEDSVHKEFSWAEDLSFSPPKISAGNTASKIFEPAVPRVIDHKPVIEKALEVLIRTVNATAGIARILPTHGHTPQLFRSAGLPAELLKIENDVNLNCENSCKVFVGNGIYSANLSTCKQRPGYPNVGHQIQSLITAPIESHSVPKNPIGVLTLFFNEPQAAIENTPEIILSFADLLSTLVEYNKLNRDAKRTELIAERQAISNEIHDSLAQSLAYTRMRTSLLLESTRTRNELMVSKYAHDIDEALESSQKTVRELITNFRCALDPSGLLHAIQTLVEQFRHRNNIFLEYINRIANLELPLEYEIQVSHIVQEALANIATHSDATHARLIVDFASDYYVFTIEDNGSGGCTFKPVEGHYGMMIMRERALRIGGEIRIESSKGLGTCVQLFFPEPRSDWRAVNE